MKACASCGCYCHGHEDRCPHCDASFGAGMPTRAAAAVLLSLAIGMNGCVSGSKYGSPDSGPQAEYGVPDTSANADADEDGWTPAEGDCDDSDASIHPEATETPDDGVDSNCNEDDNT